MFRLRMRRGPTGKISVLSGDISVLEQRGHCWTGVLPLVGPSLGILSGVPELQVHPVLLRLKLQCWLEIVQAGCDDTMIDQEISKVGVVSSSTRKVSLQFIEANPQHFPCETKDRRWKVLP